jgi:hypothetical protein
MVSSKSGKSLPDNQPKIIIPENVSEFYVNSLLVAATPFDFMLLCGSQSLPSSISPVNQSFHQDTRVDVVIRMSPQHAKVAVLNIQKAIDDYETKNGAINIPKEVADALASVQQKK